MPGPTLPPGVGDGVIRPVHAGTLDAKPTAAPPKPKSKMKTINWTKIPPNAISSKSHDEQNRNSGWKFNSVIVG